MVTAGIKPHYFFDFARTQAQHFKRCGHFIAYGQLRIAKSAVYCLDEVSRFGKLET